MSKKNTIELSAGDEVYLKDIKIDSIDDQGMATCTWYNENGQSFTAKFELTSLTKSPDFPLPFMA